MQTITTIGLDIAKSVFQSAASMRKLMWSCAASSTPLRAGLLPEAAAVPNRYRSLWREQQSCLTLHRTRHLFIRQQTAVINSIRAYLAEFGIVAPIGRNGVEELFTVVADASDKRRIVPRQHSSGGKDRLGSISKRGDAICAACSSSSRSPSSAMPKSMAPSIGLGSQHC
jgi:transposase